MILLLGGAGYIGSALQRALSAANVSYRSVSRQESDYTNVNVLRRLLRELRPAFLINCAGYTGKPNVDACERNQTECLFANALLPGITRLACEERGLPWGHVSSGCIYRGARAGGTGFCETDAPNFTFRQGNCSYYSGTKALGEELIAPASHCYIWRVRMAFENRDNPRNLLSKLLRYDKLLDVQNSLSHLDEAAAAMIACWQQRVPFGTYHLTNPGYVSTREIAGLMKAHGVAQREFAFYESEAEFLREPGRTPRSHCVLDAGKIAAAGIQMTEVHEALDRALRHWQA